jgi:hypothetical protein
MLKFRVRTNRRSTGRGLVEPQSETPRNRRTDMAAKKGSGGKSSGGKYRSAKTGRYVTKKYGQGHKSTTVKESK